MFSRFPYWILLCAALAVWLAAGWRHYSHTRALQPAQMARTIGKDIQRREASLEKLLKNDSLVKKMFSQGLNDRDIYRLQKAPYYLYAYNDSDLHFWNNNAIIIDSVVKHHGERLLKMDRGVYLMRFATAPEYLGGNTIAALFPISYYYTVSNKYIESSVAAGDYIPPSTEFSMEKIAGGHAVTDAEGKVLLYARFPQGEINEWTPDGLSLWLMAFAALTSVAWIHLAMKYLTARKGNWALLFVMLALIVVGRTAFYLFGLPFGLKNVLLFSPSLYSSNVFLYSLGDVLLNALLLIWLFIVLFRHTPYQRLFDGLKDVTQKGALAIGGAIGIAGSTYGFVHLIISLVRDSNISFELSHFGTTSIFTIAGLFTIAAIVFIACIVVYLLNLWMNKAIDHKWLKYLLIALATALTITLHKDNYEEHIKYFAGMAVWLLALVVLLDVKKLTSRIDLLTPNMVFWVIFMCVFCTGTIQYVNNVKERQQRKSFAERIISQKDAVTEYAFINIAREIENDDVIQQYYRYPTAQDRPALNEHLDALYLSGQLRRYTPRVYLYAEDGTPLPGNRDTTSMASLDRQKELAEIVPPGLLFFRESAQDGHYYLASLPITDELNGAVLGYMYIDLALKQSATETVYPELLQPGTTNPNPIEDEYSYAIYINKTLVAQRSDYPFPINLRPYPRTAEFSFSEEGGVSSLWYKPSENKTVRVIHNHSVWIEVVTIFSYLFGIEIILAFFAVVYQLYISKLLSGKHIGKGFKNIPLSRRVHFAMLSMVFISFLIIGVVTVTFFNNQYYESNQQRLQSTMQVISQSVHEYLKQQNSLNDDSLQNIERTNPRFKHFITTLANNQKVDINLFNNLGILEITSQDEIYDRALLARIIRPDAYRQLFIEQKSLHMQDESIGKLRYLSCYVPLRDEYGNAAGYLNVPYFASEKYLESQISNILVTLINLYAFIFLISSMLTGLLTRWLTRTFDIIINQFSRINLQKNEQIEWPYNDEIGTLVREYNKMVKKVEENAVILAQNERESAWREMARQVAHEIKNPLTPMKLNIQYLQQALRNDHPNAKQMADKVSTSLIEQIDNLSYIASEFSNFAKMPEARPEELVINDLLNVALELYLNEPTVRVRLDKTEEALVVFTDKSQLLRVFTNLLENAIQSIPEDRDGRVHVILSRDGDNALISVRDNGQGIDEDIAERIFQPYFTTKSSGTGLGLAMTKKIIEFWQGQIWFDTVEGEGTTFFIRLPLSGNNGEATAAR
ncbi:MAG: HAMP domain-containing histidine kinase [Flavipsychrobacter sp.]|nr:HAMP domain-containing histidine kinase [Flavipsychrobacter sp.]